MSGIACEFSDELYASMKDYMEGFNAETDDAAAILVKAAQEATKCTLHRVPDMMKPVLILV